MMGNEPQQQGKVFLVLMVIMFVAWPSFLVGLLVEVLTTWYIGASVGLALFGWLLSIILTDYRDGRY